MTLQSVKNISQTLIKDEDRSGLFQNVMYSTPCMTDGNISVMTKFNCILPSIFEIDIPDGSTKQEILPLVVKTVSQIAFKLHDVNKCPGCGSQVFHFGENVFCLNLDCIMSGDHKNTLYKKFAILTPDIPIDFLVQLINMVGEAGLPLTITSVIEYAKSLTKQESDYDVVSRIESFLINFVGRKNSRDVRDDIQNSITSIIARDNVEAFLSSIGRISISQIMTAAVADINVAGIEIAVKFYNNMLINMIVDVDTVFEPLFNLGVDTGIRILMTNVMNINKSLVDNILCLTK